MRWCLGLLCVSLAAAQVRVSPVLFSGARNPVKVLSAAQSSELSRLLGNYGRPAPTSVSVGYRGFRVEGLHSRALYVRGAAAAEHFLLAIFDLHEAVAGYVRGEIDRDHAGELELPDEAPPGEAKDPCKCVVGPDTVPVYDPKHDDHGCFVSHAEDNNAYNYATDISTDSFAQPGDGSGHEWTDNKCEVVQAAMVSDGLEWLGKTLPAGPPKKGHYMALLMWYMQDYHMVRLDANGFWSQKQGDGPTSDTDNKGHNITDPSKAYLHPYKQFCGYFRVVPSTAKIAPEHDVSSAPIVI